MGFSIKIYQKEEKEFFSDLTIDEMDKCIREQDKLGNSYTIRNRFDDEISKNTFYRIKLNR